MPSFVSHAGAIPVGQPTVSLGERKATALPALAHSQVVGEQTAPSEAAPALRATLEVTAFAIVQQALDDLEAQGLLMLFDQQEQVAKRLTGDLLAAGVLPKSTQVEPMLPTDTEAAAVLFVSKQEDKVEGW